MITVHLAAAALYGGLVACAGAVAWARRRASSDTRRNRATSILIAYVVGATFLAGITQVDLWPLSSWSLMTRAPSQRVGDRPIYLRLAAVDDAGNDHTLDHRALEPFAMAELMAWLRGPFQSLPPADRDSAARYLLERVNVARARVAEGSSPGTQGRTLGPFRAPFHQLLPRRWTTTSSVPATPFVGLRLYREWWDLDERAADPRRVDRSLLYSYPSGLASRAPARDGRP